ncbi:MAG TPA: hypothetical protein VJJ78_00030 [Candidatus Saccharimonadales bacterium]|nr:hypothetical protein [Candidatus Saccharimonadales bacterium]
MPNSDSTPPPKSSQPGRFGLVAIILAAIMALIAFLAVKLAD